MGSPTAKGLFASSVLAPSRRISVWPAIWGGIFVYLCNTAKLALGTGPAWGGAARQGASAGLCNHQQNATAAQVGLAPPQHRSRAPPIGRATHLPELHEELHVVSDNLAGRPPALLHHGPDGLGLQSGPAVHVKSVPTTRKLALPLRPPPSPKLEHALSPINNPAHLAAQGGAGAHPKSGKGVGGRAHAPARAQRHGPQGHLLGHGGQLSTWAEAQITPRCWQGPWWRVGGPAAGVVGKAAGGRGWVRCARDATAAAAQGRRAGWGRSIYGV